MYNNKKCPISSPNLERLALFCLKLYGYICNSHKYNFWQHPKMYKKFNQVIEDNK